MLDALSRGLGTLEEPRYRSDAPTNLTAVIPLALLSGNLGMPQEELDELGARIVVLTHGEPEAFLSGAVLTHAVSTLLRQPEITLDGLLQDTVNAVQLQFGRQYYQTTGIWELLQHAAVLASSRHIAPMDAMEQLGCRTAPEVLAGALYACLTCHGDFDAAMITAVNHSGRSAAVGAITGAVLGARLGEEALPEFYLESLEPAAQLLELADDLTQGCPLVAGSNLFDDDWDRKYLHAGL
jgi:ADP-ribosylglycohydrolase